MFDVVIIGSGAAGLTTALNIDRSLNVLILTADAFNGANTKRAQGGIAASWQASNLDKELHVLDTLKAGSFQNDVLAVESLVEDSSKAIDFLIECGVAFDKEDGQYDLTAEGAHSCRRIFHAEGDSTGAVIYKSLLTQVTNASNITISDLSFVTEVKEVLCGQYQVCYNKDEYSYAINTNNLVIACGGYGNLFKETTNSKYINGCNLMIAKQLGLSVSNLHLLQFHPTGFKDKDGKCHLLTESLRGEGARFYSPQTGYFMSNYHNLGDVAPRDIASRGVYQEQKNGNEVFLDCKPVAIKTNIYKRFQTVSKVVADSSYDLTVDLIPICPVAHYSIGGIDITIDGKTSKPGVYAVGEAAMSGIHGANRLASNSLLECVVYGIRVGSQITRSDSYSIEEVGHTKINNLKQLEQVQNILSECCNIVRNDRGLKIGYRKLNELSEDLIVEVAKDMVLSCIENDSVGCHYKETDE